MKNSGNWFNYDSKKYLVDDNKKMENCISNEDMSDEALEAMKQYVPNSTLIPTLMVGYEPPSIYQFAPVSEDMYDNDDDDIDNMPLHKQDGVDFSDMVNDLRTKTEDVKEAYTIGKEKFEAYQKAKKSHKVEEKTPSK